MPLISSKVRADLFCFSCCPLTENYNQKPHNVVSYQYFIFFVYSELCFGKKPKAIEISASSSQSATI